MTSQLSPLFRTLVFDEHSLLKQLSVETSFVHVVNVFEWVSIDDAPVLLEPLRHIGLVHAAILAVQANDRKFVAAGIFFLNCLFNLIRGF